jgi:kinesin family protein 2/24
LIDLAGSEVARDVTAHGAERMRETRQINISLSVLKDCIRGKAQADATILLNGEQRDQRLPHIPYRQSALTRVLKHVFDPMSARKCKTVVIACINPSLADVGPSKNTLRFAEMLRVLVPAKVRTNQDGENAMYWTNAQMRDWIKGNVSLRVLRTLSLWSPSMKLTIVRISVDILLF